MSVAYTHAPSDPRIRRHCEALARQGWHVIQLGLGVEGEQHVGRLNGVVLVRWHRPRYRGGRLLRYAVSYLGFFLWVRALLARLSRARGVQVVQVNNVPTFLVWAARVVRNRGGGVVLDLHDPEPELFLSKFGGRPGARLVARGLALHERLAARQAGLVLCVHEQHRAVTQTHGVPGIRLRTIINLADDRLFPLLPPRRAGPFVAFHGTVARRMGLDFVLGGIRALIDRGIALRMAIWGDGDATGELRQLRDRLGLSSVVEIPARRFRPDELKGLLTQVGLGIVPIRRDTFTDVMLPTKLLEYVRLGIPAVVTWTPTIAQYFPDEAVYYVKDMSAAAVADAVARALADPDEAQNRVRRAQALPIACSWQDREGEYVKLIEEAANCGHSTS